MRWTLVLALATCVARPLAAQFVGVMPLWNDPSGSNGSQVVADVGAPNTNAGGGTAYGARLLAIEGLASATFGVARWSPNTIRPGGSLSGQPDLVTAIGLQAGLRVLGGGNLPFGLNVVGGGNWLKSSFNDNTGELVVFYGAGVNANLAPRGVALQPYLVITGRSHHVHDAPTATGTGWTIGARAELGRFGLHVGYDLEDRGPCPWQNWQYPAPICPSGSSSRILGAGVELAL